MKTATKALLPWFGSDASVASRIAVLLADVTHITIPFAGGLGILQHLTARGVLVNDLHRDAIHFYRILQSAPVALTRRCSETLCHPAELELARETLAKSGSPVDRAWAFWALCWLGRKGAGGTGREGNSISIRRTAAGGNNASRIMSAVGDLNAWADQFKRCEFTCDDFRDVLTKGHDRDDCGFYCDPPWVDEDKYLHGFGEPDHRDLAAALSRFERSRVVLRYGDCELVRELYPHEAWHWTEATSRTQSNGLRGEVWIKKRPRQLKSLDDAANCTAGARRDGR